MRIQEENMVAPQINMMEVQNSNMQAKVIDWFDCQMPLMSESSLKKIRAPKPDLPGICVTVTWYAWMHKVNSISNYAI
jgi:hypothetical protein